MNAEKLFSKAVKKHDHAIELINELSEVITLALPEYDKAKAEADFDYLLQCILLRQSLADGIMDKNEIAFIKGIVSSGDILSEIRASLKATLDENTLKIYNWATVYELPTLIQAELIKELTEYSSVYITPFAITCAVADAVTKKNYYNAITRDICSIIACFAKIDGKREVEEIDEGSIAYIELFAKKYISVKSFVEYCIKEGKTIAKEIEKDVKAFDKKINKFLDGIDTTALEEKFDEFEHYASDVICEILTSDED